MSGDKGNDKDDSPNTGPAGLVTNKKTGKTSYGTVEDAQKARIDNFIRSRENEAIKKNKNAKLTVTKFITGLGIKQNPKMASYFANTVLGSKNSMKNFGITQADFANMTLAEQTASYKSYLDNRMSGATDAYGNVKTGYTKLADGSYKNFGGEDNRITEAQMLKEMEQEQQQEDEIKITEDEYKKRRGLIGSRSMFGNAGGRGYFDPV